MNESLDFPRIEVRVSHDPIEVSEVLKKATHRGWGAETLFLGHVRELNLGKQVVAVSYDAFIPHAKKTLIAIANEASAQWGSQIGIVIQHRLGRLEVGETSVAIAVGSKHRDDSYQASRYIIEELKDRAAIWKKEHYIDGDSEWLKGHALCSHRIHGDRMKNPHAHNSPGQG